MKLENVIEMDNLYYMRTFGSRTPVCFVRGEGMKLWDTEGKVYHDYLAGIAVNSLGHSHPKVVGAITEQAAKLIHCSNLYFNEPQAKLAKLLADVSCCDRFFFCNSGAEANEGAIKLARIYFKKKGFYNKYEIITLDKSFHGRTMATLAATGQEKYQKPYAPLLPKFVHVPKNDIDALKQAITPQTCAILLEPIQGEGGVFPLDQDYMQQVRALCDENDILLIFDEVQTGIGRTGKFFGYQHFQVEPDIMTLAKGLGAGIPIGAVCAKDFVAKAFEQGDHGSTFGGNPLACHVAHTVLTTILEEKLCDHAALMGSYLSEQLAKLKEKYAFIVDIRGKGLMAGIELDMPEGAKINERCFQRGCLIGNIGMYILRVVPPLIIGKPEIDLLVHTLDEVFSEYKS